MRALAFEFCIKSEKISSFVSDANALRVLIRQSTIYQNLSNVFIILLFSVGNLLIDLLPWQERRESSILTHRHKWCIIKKESYIGLGLLCVRIYVDYIAVSMYGQKFGLVRVIKFWCCCCGGSTMITHQMCSNGAGFVGRKIFSLNFDNRSVLRCCQCDQHTHTRYTNTEKCQFPSKVKWGETGGEKSLSSLCCHVNTIIDRIWTGWTYKNI